MSLIRNRVIPFKLRFAEPFSLPDITKPLYLPFYLIMDKLKSLSSHTSSGRNEAFLAFKSIVTQLYATDALPCRKIENMELQPFIEQWALPTLVAIRDTLSYMEVKLDSMSYSWLGDFLKKSLTNPEHFSFFDTVMAALVLHLFEYRNRQNHPTKCLLTK